MKDQLLELEKQACAEIDAISDVETLEAFRVKYLGKKGVLTSRMKTLGALSPEDRPVVGKLANQIKVNLTRRYQDVLKGLESKRGGEADFIDVTLPGREPVRGHLHLSLIHI